MSIPRLLLEKEKAGTAINGESPNNPSSASSKFGDIQTCRFVLKYKGRLKEEALDPMLY
jgi:hypothetical protein